MRITGLYAALLALLMMGLAVRVMLLRNRHRIGVGDGGSTAMNLGIRAHANAIEYVPMALILLLVLELNQTRPVLLHAFGIMLVVGRVLHALGLSRSAGSSPGRLVGIALTLLAIIVMAVLLLWQYLIIHLLT
jgi:uncharacterized membrane protein YecN with MAPEG domain